MVLPWFQEVIKKWEGSIKQITIHASCLSLSASTVYKKNHIFCMLDNGTMGNRLKRIITIIYQLNVKLYLNVNKIINMKTEEFLLES